MQISIKIPTAVAACAAIGVVALAQPASAQLTVFMDGLANPRGLAFNGNQLFVAEGGAGGDILVGSNPEGDQYYGTTGRISTRSIGGMQSVWLQGLPSLAGLDGSGAAGPSDVAFGPDGLLYAVIGLGNDPTLRSTSPLAQQALGGWLGTVIRQNADFSVDRLFDVAGYELANNPDGGAVDSNPFSLAFTPGAGTPQFAVSDAGGNDVLLVDVDGTVNGTFVLPAKPNPLPFGPPFYEAVPTGLSYDATGSSLYVGELTGVPFPDGGAQIHDLLAGTVVASGLTNIIDVAVAADGTLYALSFDIDGIINSGPFGGLYRINGDGSADLLVSDGLIAPTGLAIGPDGAFYISNLGVTPDAGQVLRFVVPEPSSLALLGLGGLAVLRRRR